LAFLTGYRKYLFAHALEEFLQQQHRQRPQIDDPDGTLHTGMISALNPAMAEFKTVKKGQTRQLPLSAEPKDWLRR
jgi:hypothetical protein